MTVLLLNLGYKCTRMPISRPWKMVLAINVGQIVYVIGRVALGFGWEWAGGGVVLLS